MFTGSYVALVTPMFENGDIDYKSLEKLVKFHVEQGTHGIVSVGTTGESATLPFDEHVDVVRETVAMASGAIPVIAGSGANSTAEAIFLTEQLGAVGVDGFLSVVPYYNKPQQAGMVAHLTQLLTPVTFPLFYTTYPDVLWQTCSLKRLLSLLLIKTSLV